MTDSAAVELAETCRCGASTTIKTPALPDARALVREWRKIHPCTTREQDDAGRRHGTTTTFLGGPQADRIGFRVAGGAERPTPTSHPVADRHRTLTLSTP